MNPRLRALVVVLGASAFLACGGSDDEEEAAGGGEAGAAGAAGTAGAAAGKGGSGGSSAGSGGASAGSGGASAGSGGASAGAGGASAGSGGASAGAGGASAGAGGASAGAGGASAGSGGASAGSGGASAGAGGASAGAGGASAGSGGTGGAGAGGVSSFVGKNAIHNTADTMPPGQPAQHITAIGISDHSTDHCALAQVGDKIQTDQSLLIIVITYGENGGAAPPLMPGTYPVGGTIGVSVGVQVSTSALDASCVKGAVTKYEDNSAGTITITAASSTEVSGSYNLSLAGGLTTGTFVAPKCTPAQPPPTPTNQCLPASTP